MRRTVTIRVAAMLVAAVAVTALLGAGLAAAQSSRLPAYKGADWEHILDGEINRRGAAVGFHAAGPNLYPRSCNARTNSCERGACCDLGCNARAEGRPSTTQPWSATVHVRRNCQAPWVRKQHRSTMFPIGWSVDKIRATIMSAYKIGRADRDRRERWCGCAGGLTIFGWHNRGFITTAYPDTRRRCGCEAQDPLRNR